MSVYYILNKKIHSSENLPQGTATKQERKMAGFHWHNWPLWTPFDPKKSTLDVYVHFYQPNKQHLIQFGPLNEYFCLPNEEEEKIDIGFAGNLLSVVLPI